MSTLKFFSNREKEIQKLAKQVFSDYFRELIKLKIQKPNGQTKAK